MMLNTLKLRISFYHVKLDNMSNFTFKSHRALAVIAAPKHRPTEAIRHQIMDYLNGVGKDDRYSLWWQTYSADAPAHQISDDDYLSARLRQRSTLLKILIKEIHI